MSNFIREAEPGGHVGEVVPSVVVDSTELDAEVPGSGEVARVALHSSNIVATTSSQLPSSVVLHFAFASSVGVSTTEHGEKVVHGSD